MGVLSNLLFIFVLRVVDVSLGTLRVNLLVRGYRNQAAAIGFVECLVWLTAASRVLAELDDVAQMVAFAGGYAGGTLVGCWLNDLLALGQTLMRVIVPHGGPDVVSRLRAAGCVVTAVAAEGRDGAVQMAFSVIPKKRAGAALAVVKEACPEAFVTFEEVRPAERAFIPGPLQAPRLSWGAAKPRV